MELSCVINFAAFYKSILNDNRTLGNSQIKHKDVSQSIGLTIFSICRMLQTKVVNERNDIESSLPDKVATRRLVLHFYLFSYGHHQLLSSIL